MYYIYIIYMYYIKYIYYIFQYIFQYIPIYSNIYNIPIYIMKNILILIIFTLSITSVVAVNVTYVNFKGNFSNGTILYSDNYFINNGTIIGYDVYPISKNCIIETVNKIKRVCRIQTIYLNRTKIKCELIENQSNCFIVPYQVPK